MAAIGLSCEQTETSKVLAWPDMGSCGSKSTPRVLAWALIGLTCERTETPKFLAWPDMGSYGSRSTSKVLVLVSRQSFTRKMNILT